MSNATPMAKQPLVTLNTSAHEIPFQSLESFGEYCIESEQLLLSIWNDYDIVKEDMREESNMQICCGLIKLRMKRMMMKLILKIVMARKVNVAAHFQWVHQRHKVTKLLKLHLRNN